MLNSFSIANKISIDLVFSSDKQMIKQTRRENQQVIQ